MMAIGPWVGLHVGVLVLVSVTLTGILFAIGFAVARGSVREAASNITAITVASAFVFKRVLRMSDVPRVPAPEGMHRFPYGLAIMAGTWITAGGVLLWQ